MTASPVLVLHIASGTLGVLAGFIAVFLRKGSRRHGRAGSLFVLAMMSLGLSGIYLALRKSQITNVLGGSLAFYLAGTAWLTVRRKIWKSGFLDWAGLLLILAVGTTEVTFGLQALLSPTGLKYDYPPAPYFIFGAVALLAAAGDLRLLIRGAISASPRLARHLWRMCFALFIASASIFLARPQLFPAFLRKTGILALLSFLPLILLIFWMLRVRFARAYSSTRQHDGKPNGKVMNTQEGHEFLLVP